MIIQICLMFIKMVYKLSTMLKLITLCILIVRQFLLIIHIELLGLNNNDPLRERPRGFSPGPIWIIIKLTNSLDGTVKKDHWIINSQIVHFKIKEMIRMPRKQHTKRISWCLHSQEKLSPPLAPMINDKLLIRLGISMIVHLIKLNS